MKLNIFTPEGGGSWGFTLVEIISVLILLGIIASVAVPKYFDMQSVADRKAAEAALSEAQVRVNAEYSKHIYAGFTCEAAVNYVKNLGNLADNSSNASMSSIENGKSFDFGQFSLTPQKSEITSEGTDVSVISKVTGTNHGILGKLYVPSCDVPECTGDDCESSGGSSGGGSTSCSKYDKNGVCLDTCQKLDSEGNCDTCSERDANGLCKDNCTLGSDGNCDTCLKRDSNGKCLDDCEIGTDGNCKISSTEQLENKGAYEWQQKIDKNYCYFSLGTLIKNKNNNTGATEYYVFSANGRDAVMSWEIEKDINETRLYGYGSLVTKIDTSVPITDIKACTPKVDCNYQEGGVYRGYDGELYVFRSNRANNNGQFSIPSDGDAGWDSWWIKIRTVAPACYNWGDKEK